MQTRTLQARVGADGILKQEVPTVAQVAHGLTLISHNVREFGRIVGLQIEDWEAETDSPYPALQTHRSTP